MGASVARFTIEGEVSGTRRLKKPTAKINITNRILRLKVLNDILYGIEWRHEKLVFSYHMGLWVLKEMAIVSLLIGIPATFSCVGILFFVRGDVVHQDICILNFGRKQGLKCVVKCRRIL